MERKILRYEGKDITVTYERPRCIHAERCVKDLPEVFDPERKPWVDADATEADNLAAMILTCPSGALHYERNNGGSTETAPDNNIATLDVDGPLWVHGNLEISGIEGETKEFRAALCRCGASKYKPFCDGSHEKLPFKDDGKGKPGNINENTAEGVLTINPVADGPLTVSGPLEIRNAEGDVLYRGEKTSLCRCGASSNKPFCDGSHMGINFKTD
ncbi:MAG: CDGSH iron-sulfur domain-containing protein [Acidiferrobacterales bacterium]